MHPFPRWLLRFNAALFLGPSPVVVDAQIVSVKDVFHQDAFVLKNLLVAYQAKVELGFRNKLAGIRSFGPEGSIFVIVGSLFVLLQVIPHVAPGPGREDAHAAGLKV